MRITRVCGVVLVVLAAPVALAAQKPARQTVAHAVAAPAPRHAMPAHAAASPVVAAAQSLVQRYGHNLTEAANEMPADKYGYKPTPQQMSFGQLVSHISESNDLLCSHISGLAEPAEKVPAATAPKAQLVAAMERSFSYCDEALGKVDESKLGDEVPFFGTRTASRAMVLLALTGDLFDHYSAMAIYLRLNGLLPPTARPRPSM